MKIVVGHNNISFMHYLDTILTRDCCRNYRDVL